MGCRTTQLLIFDLHGLSHHPVTYVRSTSVVAPPSYLCSKYMGCRTTQLLMLEVHELSHHPVTYALIHGLLHHPVTYVQSTWVIAPPSYLCSKYTSCRTTQLLMFEVHRLSHHPVTYVRSTWVVAPPSYLCSNTWVVAPPTYLCSKYTSCRTTQLLMGATTRALRA